MNANLKSASSITAAPQLKVAGKRLTQSIPESMPVLRPGWRQLHGDFYESGATIESHDFELKQLFEWSRSFYPESLEICLNIEGQGVIQRGEQVFEVEPLTAAFYFPGRQALQGWRVAGQRHHFITLKFSAQFLRQRLALCDGALHPLVEAFMQGRSLKTHIGELHRLTAGQQQITTQLLNPPVPLGGRSLWYEAKLLELISGMFFERKTDDELFCDRQKRIARERVDRVILLLEQNLVEPLSLEEIGRRAGCSPFHLSRTFSAETGTTIPQYLRRLRMERAAGMLQAGKFNVTEVALAVGYSSLSHFSQAFCQTMGCCPGLYPLKGVSRS